MKQLTIILTTITCGACLINSGKGEKALGVRTYELVSTSDDGNAEEDEVISAYYSEVLDLLITIPSGYRPISKEQTTKLKEEAANKMSGGQERTAVLSQVIGNPKSLILVKGDDLTQNILIQGIPKMVVTKELFESYEQRFKDVPKSYDGIKVVKIIEKKLSVDYPPKYMYFKTQVTLSSGISLEPSATFWVDYSKQISYSINVNNKDVNPFEFVKSIR